MKEAIDALGGLVVLISIFVGSMFIYLRLEGSILLVIELIAFATMKTQGETEDEATREVTR